LKRLDVSACSETVSKYDIVSLYCISPTDSAYVNVNSGNNFHLAPVTLTLSLIGRVPRPVWCPAGLLAGGPRLGVHSLNAPPPSLLVLFFICTLAAFNFS
jgi:hypothetical protein